MTTENKIGNFIDKIIRRASKKEKEVENLHSSVFFLYLVTNLLKTNQFNLKIANES